jgi:hypothetical protein
MPPEIEGHPDAEGDPGRCTSSALKSTTTRARRNTVKEKKQKSKQAKSASKGPKDSKNERLGPGGLDKLVLGWMRRNKKSSPHTASAVGKGIERSSGAVANCLRRLEKGKQVRLAQPKPRKYELVEKRAK